MLCGKSPAERVQWLKLPCCSTTKIPEVVAPEGAVREAMPFCVLAGLASGCDVVPVLSSGVEVTPKDWRSLIEGS